MQRVQGKGSSFSRGSSPNLYQWVGTPRDHSIRVIELGGPSGRNASGLRATSAAFHAGLPGCPSRDCSWLRCPDAAGTRQLPEPLPCPSLRSCSPRRVVLRPGPGRGDQLPSPPPHPSPVAPGAAYFSDPPPSTPTSANSQKNRWVSAPARACPASPASTLALAAPGWPPSDRPPALVQLRGARGSGGDAAPGRQPRLPNSPSPGRPNSPGGCPSEFPPQQPPFSTPPAASREGISPGRGYAARRPPSRSHRCRTRGLRGVVAQLTRSQTSQRQEWTWSGGEKEDSSPLSTPNHSIY